MTSTVKAGHIGVNKSRTVFLRIASRLRRLAFLIVLLAFWQLASTYLLNGTTRTLLPPPSAMFAAAWELLNSGELLRNLHDSLMREAVAFLWACVAIPIGIAMSWWRIVEEQLDPVMEILRPVPPLAWIPLSILWFGIGDT